MYDPRNPKFKTLQEEFESMGLDPDEAIAVIKATGMREHPVVRANDPRTPLLREEEREVWQDEFVDAVVTERRYSRAPRGAAKSRGRRDYRKVRSKERLRKRRYRKTAGYRRRKRISKRKLSRIRPRKGYRRQTSDTDSVANLVDQIQDLVAQATKGKALNVIEQHVMAMDKCEWICWELADRFDFCGEETAALALDSVADAAHEVAASLVSGDATIDDLEDRMQEIVAQVAEGMRLYDVAGDEGNLTESRGGLGDDTVRELIDMAGESAELDGAGRGGRNVGKIPSSVSREVKRFESDCARALKDWVRKNGDKMADGVDADDLYGEKGAYLVLMTLRGEGVGIWDGDWDHFFKDEEVPDDLEKFLERKLGKYADDTGGGSLNQAFEDAAFEVFGGSDEQREEYRQKMQERVKTNKETRVAIRALTMGGMRSSMSPAEAVAALRGSGMSDEEIRRLMTQGGMDDRAIGRAMKPTSRAAMVRQMYDSETTGGKKLIEDLLGGKEKFDELCDSDLDEDGEEGQESGRVIQEDVGEPEINVDLTGRDVEVTEDCPIRALATGRDIPTGEYTIINQRRKYVTMAGENGAFHVAISEFDLDEANQQFVFVIHDDDGYEVGGSVHEDPTAGFQVLKDGLGEKEAMALGKKLAKKWGAKLLMFKRTGQGHTVKYTKEDVDDDELSEALPNGKVSTFYMVLSSYLTQYDQQAASREAKKGRVNIYRLGHLLGAAQKAEAKARKAGIWDSDSPEDLEKFRKIVKAEFTNKFPPINRWEKALDKFIQSGKMPTLKSDVDYDDADLDEFIDEADPQAVAKKMVKNMGKKPGDKGYDALVKKFAANAAKIMSKGKKKEDLDWGFLDEAGGKGSGSGQYRADKRITTVKGMKKGQLVICKSLQFGATNVARVTKVDKAGWNGIFVNPKDPTKKRMNSDREFHVWDFEMAGDNEHYYSIAGGPSVGIGNASNAKGIVGSVQKELNRIRGVEYAGEIDRWWEGSGSPASLWLHFEVGMSGKEGDYETSAGRMGKGWTLDENPVKVKNAILKALKKLGARSVKITDYPKSQGEYVPSEFRGTQKARRYYDRDAFRVEFTFDDVLRESMVVRGSRFTKQTVDFDAPDWEWPDDLEGGKWELIGTDGCDRFGDCAKATYQHQDSPSFVTFDVGDWQKSGTKKPVSYEISIGSMKKKGTVKSPEPRDLQKACDDAAKFYKKFHADLMKKIPKPSGWTYMDDLGDIRYEKRIDDDAGINVTFYDPSRSIFGDSNEGALIQFYMGHDYEGAYGEREKVLPYKSLRDMAKVLKQAEKLADQWYKSRGEDMDGVLREDLNEASYDDVKHVAIIQKKGVAHAGEYVVSVPKISDELKKDKKVAELLKKTFDDSTKAKDAAMRLFTKATASVEDIQGEASLNPSAVLKQLEKLINTSGVDPDLVPEFGFSVSKGFELTVTDEAAAKKLSKLINDKFKRNTVAEKWPSVGWAIWEKPSSESLGEAGETYAVIVGNKEAGGSKFWVYLVTQDKKEAEALYKKHSGRGGDCGFQMLVRVTNPDKLPKVKQEVTVKKGDNFLKRFGGSIIQSRGANLRCVYQDDVELDDETLDEAIKWDEKQDDVYGAIAKVKYAFPGKPKKAIDVAFRIDGRGGKGFRVDRHDPLLKSWEAIDGVAPGLPSLEKAKAFVEKYIKAVEKENTFTPSRKALKADVEYDGLQEELTLGKKDKAVIDAFTSGKAAEGNKLSTDGKKLDGHWMGGNNIAVWKGGKIHFNDLGSKAAQTVQRAVRKNAAPNDLAEEVLGEADVAVSHALLSELSKKTKGNKKFRDGTYKLSAIGKDKLKIDAPMISFLFYPSSGGWKVDVDDKLNQYEKTYPLGVKTSGDTMGDVDKVTDHIAKKFAEDVELDERQKGPASQGFDHEGQFRKGSFKISKQWLDMLKNIPEIGDKFEKGLFTRQVDHINRLDRDDLCKMFGTDNMPDAQDVIARNGRKAFQIWMRNVGKIDAKLGKGIRELPDMAPLWFYAVMVRVTGRDMANIVLRKYFVSEPEYAWMAKARVKTEDLEIDEGWFDNMKISDLKRDPASKFDAKKTASLQAMKVSSKDGKIEPWVFNAAKDRSRFGTVKVLKKGKDKTGYFVIFDGDQYDLDNLLVALASASSYAGSNELKFYLVPPMSEDVDLDEAERVWPRDVKVVGRGWNGNRVEAKFKVNGKQYTVQSAMIGDDLVGDKKWRDRWVFDMQVALADHLSGKKSKLVDAGKGVLQLPASLGADRDDDDGSEVVAEGIGSRAIDIAKNLSRSVNKGDSKDTIKSMAFMISSIADLARGYGVYQVTVKDLQKAAEKVGAYTRYGAITAEGWSVIKQASRQIEREAALMAKGKSKSKELHHLTMLLHRLGDALDGLDPGLRDVLNSPSSDIGMSADSARRLEHEDWEDEVVLEEPEPRKSTAHLSKELSSLLDKLTKESPPGDEEDEDDDDDSESPDDDGQDEAKVPGKDAGEIGYGGPKPGKEARPTE